MSREADLVGIEGTGGGMEKYKGRWRQRRWLTCEVGRDEGEEGRGCLRELVRIYARILDYKSHYLEKTKYKESKEDLLMVFFDLEKAYDKVPREIL